MKQSKDEGLSIRGFAHQAQLLLHGDGARLFLYVLAIFLIAVTIIVFLIGKYFSSSIQLPALALILLPLIWFVHKFSKELFVLAQDVSSQSLFHSGETIQVMVKAMYKYLQGSDNAGINAPNDKTPLLQPQFLQNNKLVKSTRNIKKTKP